MRTVSFIVLSAMAAACGTDLEASDAGRKISGRIRYREGGTLADTFVEPGLLVLLQQFEADPATGMPGRTTAPSPAGAIFHKFTDGELEAARGDGYAYEISNISLGDPRFPETLVPSWPFLILSAFIDFDGFDSANLQTALQTGPSGAYPNQCVLGIAQALLGPDRVPVVQGALNQAAPGSGTAANAQRVIDAVNARLPAALTQALGSPAVIVTRDVPTENIDMEVNDPVAAGGAPPSCAAVTAGVVQQQLGLAIQNFLTTGTP